MTNWNIGASASPFVAAMAGARLVLASEIEERRKINDAVVKDLTGGDVVTARFLFSNPFTFKPTHKIWLYGNHKPVVSDSSLGFWRRIRLIPFPVSIPDDVKRPMGEMLATFDKEMPGILKWAVLGCLMWQSDGLKMPEVINKATLEYRDEEDLVQQFLDDKCEMHPNFTVEKEKLFAEWRTWCTTQGEEHTVRTQRWLTQQIIRHGYHHQGSGRVSLAGLRLRGNG
jgi:putative DNA primase/helicase